MSALATIFKDSRFHALLLTVLLGCAIWFFGPLVSFANHHPLEASINRLICLLALAVLWGLTNMFPEARTNAKLNNIYQINNEIRIMHNNLKEALKRTKSGLFSRLFSKNKTNWYVVLGPQNSGKNTLLQTALNELELNENSLTAITNTHLCDYWLFPNTVFMSVAGELFEENLDNKHHQALLQQLTNLIIRHRINFSGAVIALPLQEMLGDSEQLQQQYENMRQYLQQIQLEFPGTPINIVITKCDRIAGFNEFFDNMDEDERTQHCGIEFGLPPYKKPITELFQQHFDRFIQRLNDRVIPRLHHEHETSVRQRIKDFPTQLEILKPTLGRILNEILPSTNISLNGIFFTSSTIQDTPINNLLPSMQRAFQLPGSVQPSLEPMQQKSYFIKQIFEKLITATPKEHPSLSRKQLTQVSLIALAFTCITGGFTYRYFQSNFKHFTEIKNVIDNASTSQFGGLIDRLKALETTMITLHGNSGGKIANEHQLIQKAYNGYWDLLQQQFLPELVQQLSVEIKSLLSRRSHPADIELLQALKVYLMLTDGKHINTKEINDWFATYWKNNMHNNKHALQMQRFLSIALKRTLPPLPINPILVQQARETLKQISPSQFVMTLLEQDTQAPQITLVKNHASLIIDPQFNTAPVNFSQILFYDIYHHQIPHDATKIASSYWVFNNDDDEDLDDDFSAESLTQKVRTQYLEQYVAYWKQVINHIQYNAKIDLHQYNQQLKRLTADDSPLHQLLAIVKFNTNEIANEPEFNDIVAKQFKDINQLTWQQDEQLFDNVDKLKSEMTGIVESTDQLVAAFKFAKARMQNPHHADSFNLLFSDAKNAPKVLRPFFTQLASNGWQLVLADTQHYLNLIWQNFILPEYNSHIYNHYPVFNTAKQDISLSHFARFFAPNGVMETYVSNYIDSFIDKRDYNWRWKKVNGQAIHFSQNTLEVFMRSTLIEKMFFTTQANQPNVKFTLTGLAMNPNIKTFSMILDGQEIAYHPDQTQVYPISWPGPQPDGVTITFTTTGDSSNTVTYNGIWGWFHLLDKSQITSLSSNGDSLKVNFKYDNSPLAEYQMTTESPVNPFTPNILSHFRCPKQLT